MASSAPSVRDEGMHAARGDAASYVNDTAGAGLRGRRDMLAAEKAEAASERNELGKSARDEMKYKILEIHTGSCFAIAPSERIRAFHHTPLIA
jgi:hypothetical protein